MKAHIGVPKSGLTTVWYDTKNSSTSFRGWVIVHGEEQFVSADAGYWGTKRESWHGCGLADRRAPRQGKNNMKQHPRKNKTAINIEYMKANPGQGGAPISHHQATVRLREKPDTKGC